MNVVLTGIWYPMAILRYFERALLRRDDVSLWRAGPWTGTWIPWKGGIHLPAKYAEMPDQPLPRETIRSGLPAAVVESVLPWTPDLWIQVDAGWHLVTKPTHGENVIIGTDPHVLDYTGARSLADRFYSMQAAYKQPEDLWLPYAYDPEVHYDEDLPCRYDVVCIGLQYDNRKQVMDRLARQGLKTLLDTGPAFDEYRRLVCSAPIGFSWSSKDDLIARVFELLAMRRLAVVNRVPYIGEIFEPGRDLVVFGSADEAVQQIVTHLDNPGLAETIRDNGHKVVRPHTYDARVQTILAGEEGI